MICANDLLEFQIEILRPPLPPQPLPWTAFLSSNSTNHMLPLVPLVNDCTSILFIRLI